MEKQFNKVNFVQVKNEYKKVLEGLDIVHRIDDGDEYFKIYTDFLLGKSNDYLNLYLIFEDGDVGLSDANNIYAVLDDYYDVDDNMLADIARVVGLDYDEYRFTKWVTLDSLKEDIERFGRAVNSVVGNNK